MAEWRPRGGEGGGGRPRPCLHCDGCERDYRTLLVSMRQDSMVLLCFFFGLRRQLAAAGSSKRLAAAAQAMRTRAATHSDLTQSAHGRHNRRLHTPLHSNVSFVVVHTSGVFHVCFERGHSTALDCPVPLFIRPSTTVTTHNNNKPKKASSPKTFMGLNSKAPF